MSKVKIEPEVLNSTIGVLKTKLNAQIIEAVGPIAQTIVNSGDSNKMMDDLLEAGKEFQAQFNNFTESSEKFLVVSQEVIEIDEYLRKFEIGQVEKRDTGFETKDLNSDGLLIQ